MKLHIAEKWNSNKASLSVTDSFLDLDESTRGCQDYETFNVKQELISS